METNYQTLFEITGKAYQWWYAAFGLIFFSIALIIWKFSHKSSHKKYTKYFGIASTAFAGLWTLVVAVGTYSDYSSLQQIYRQGQSRLVEGKVENFHPMPYTGHDLESFTVNGVKFEYSDYVVTPGFNNTSSHGGPIRENLQVRIHYLNNAILKLEVLRGSPASPPIHTGT